MKPDNDRVEPREVGPRIEHELQHADSPTWCVHCGTFDLWCSRYGCVEDKTSRRFDTAIPGNARRIFTETFGLETPHETR